MIEKKLYFKLFSNIYITRGYNRSIICDSQFEKIEIIPNNLYEVVENFKGKNTIEGVIQKYGNSNEETIMEYVEFLLDKGWGFLCNEKEFDLFPEIKEKYFCPYQITNSIIELRSENIEDVLSIVIPQLEFLGCKHINIVFYEVLDKFNIELLMKFFIGSIVSSIELVFEYSPLFEEKEFLLYLSKKYERISQIILFNSPRESFQLSNNELFFHLNYTKKKIESFQSCGKVEPKYFTHSAKSYFESLNYNSCLHKKISIDINKKIKNCPAMEKEFGSIYKNKLEDVIRSNNFKKLWKINKDKINICQDCEFRHICTDCRAYLERPEDIFSKPLKCGYNPYTNEWEDWSKNVIKQKGIEYYKFEF